MVTRSFLPPGKVEQVRFPFGQSFRFNRFKCEWHKCFERNFSGTKRTTFRGILRFSLQPVGIKIPIPFAQFCFGRRLALKNHFPPFPMFAVGRCSRAVAPFLFIPLYLIVQNNICARCKSDARTLWGFSRKNTCFFLAKTKARVSWW